MDMVHFIEDMNNSIQKVEESIGHMELHSHVTKTEQHQVMQAVLELSARIKLIEAHMHGINKPQ